MGLARSLLLVAVQSRSAGPPGGDWDYWPSFHLATDRRPAFLTPSIISCLITF
jgi:hypothetical protein